MNQNHAEYRDKVAAWLSSEEKDIPAGALLLLKLNKNRTLYDNIVKRKLLPKLTFELKRQLELLEKKAKHEDYNALTEAEVADFDQRVLRVVKEVMPIVENGGLGKRIDHDLLPSEVQALYDANNDLYPKMRSLHEKLKLMVNDRPCDRYPFLKEMLAFEQQIRDNWNAYDAAVAGNNTPKEDTGQENIGGSTENTANTVLMTAKEVSNARAFLSRNKENLAKLRDKDKEKYQKVLALVQERYNSLIASGNNIDDAQKSELKELGIITEK